MCGVPVDLSQADLSGANLHGTDLSRSNLAGAHLSGTELGLANVSGVDLRQSDLDLALGTATTTCDAQTALPDGWRCDGGMLASKTAPR